MQALYGRKEELDGLREHGQAEIASTAWRRGRGCSVISTLSKAVVRQQVSRAQHERVMARAGSTMRVPTMRALQAETVRR